MKLDFNSGYCSTDIFQLHPYKIDDGKKNIHYIFYNFKFKSC